MDVLGATASCFVIVMAPMSCGDQSPKDQRVASNLVPKLSPVTRETLGTRLSCIKNYVLIDFNVHGENNLVLAGEIEIEFLVRVYCL